jgi:hypothetical protein
VHGFNCVASTLNHSSGKFFTSIFERPICVGLTILFEKKIEFVKNIEIRRDVSFLRDNNSVEKAPFVTNIESPTNLDDLKFLRGRRTIFYSLDLSSALDFIKKIQNTKKERESLYADFEY